MDTFTRAQSAAVALVLIGAAGIGALIGSDRFSDDPPRYSDECAHMVQPFHVGNGPAPIVWSTDCFGDTVK